MEWLPKLQNNAQWSDPIRPEELNEFVQHTKGIVATSNLENYELAVYRSQRIKDITAKTSSRKRIKTPHSGSLGMTKENAERLIAEKHQSELIAEQKKERNNFMRMWRIERDDMYAKGVAARKLQKERVKNIKELMKQNVIIPDEMLHPIEDPEATWKATNEVWIAEEAKKKEKRCEGIRGKEMNNIHQDEEEEEIDRLFITDVIGDKNLAQFIHGKSTQNSIQEQDDFIRFGIENDDDTVQNQVENR